MDDEREAARWRWPRPRAYERISLSALLFAFATTVFGLLTTDPNVYAYGELVVVLGLGLFVGAAVSAKADAFVSGVIAGWAGFLLGSLIWVPIEYILQSSASPSGVLAALGAGAGLGIAIGLAAGLLCGIAAFTASAVASRRAHRATGDRTMR